MSNISLAVYRNVFVLIVHIDDYEDGTRLQSKRATYKEIQTWVTQKYSFHVSNLSISQGKEKYGLAKTKYKGNVGAGGSNSRGIYLVWSNEKAVISMGERIRRPALFCNSHSKKLNLIIPLVPGMGPADFLRLCQDARDRAGESMKGVLHYDRESVYP